MANSARTQPGVERTTTTPIENDTDALLKVQSAYETNKKIINGALAAVIIVVVGYFGYTKMIKAPKEEKAANAISWAQMAFQADSLNMALNGDGKNQGFLNVSKKHSGTAAGNLANYYAGICYLKMGDYQNAIKSLEKFDGKGTLVGYQAYGATGEAYMETGNTAKAIEYFQKATEDKEDVLVTPTYLYRLGMAYAASGKTNEAKEAFKRVRDEYPKSVQARDMDKELARLGETN
jgi:tetratricopeptide (TPR) repeat protein